MLEIAACQFMRGRQTNTASVRMRVSGSKGNSWPGSNMSLYNTVLE